MEEYKFLQSVLEISLSVAILAVIIVYGAKKFEKILESHRLEREHFESNKDVLIKDLHLSYKEEREDLRASLKELDVYTRKITQDTYTLIGEFRRQLLDMEATRKLEEQRIAEILKHASLEFNEEVIEMLKIIGEHLKITDRKFK